MSFDEEAVLGQVADEGMMIVEPEGELGRGAGVEQSAHITQSPRPAGQGSGAGVVDRAERVGLCQSDQAHQGAQADRALTFQHADGPLAAGFTQGCGASSPVGDLAIERTVATPQSEAVAKLTAFQAAMQGNLLPAFVEDAHLARVPPRPHRPLDVFRGHRVIGALQFDVAVAVHHAPRLMKHREQVRWQWHQGRLLQSEPEAHLLACGAMDALVGDAAFPLTQVFVVSAQTGEGAPAQGVVLEVGDPVFGLSLVFWSFWSAGQYREAVMASEGLPAWD